jgi:hypothetical protein
MHRETSPFGDVIQSWTHAEQDVWSAWSAVEQDVSQADSASSCSQVLDAVESWTRDVARLQSTVLRTTSEQVSANPFVPPLTRALFAQASRPMLRLSDMQQHLLVGWFGMARQLAERTSNPRA